jgi:hypothetical protein
MEQAIHYSQLTKHKNEYLSCLYDIAQVRLQVKDPIKVRIDGS